MGQHIPILEGQDIWRYEIEKNTSKYPKEHIGRDNALFILYTLGSKGELMFADHNTILGSTTQC